MFSSFIFGVLISCTSNNPSLKLLTTQKKLDELSYEFSLSQPKYPIKKFSSDTQKWQVRHFKRRKLEGDFDGDGITEILYESLMSHTTGKQIDSVVYTNYFKGSYDPYGTMVNAMFELDPVLKLKSLDGMDTKRLNHNWQVFGILVMTNLGNINETPGDEIALVVEWADWSNCNSCGIYSYCGDEWRQVFSFETREWKLYSDEGEMLELAPILEKKDSIWYYLDEDFIDGGENWRKLNSCFCVED